MYKTNKHNMSGVFREKSERRKLRLMYSEVKMQQKR